MTENWCKHLDQNNYVGILFLDFRKAFDSINHDIIKKKPTKYGVSGDLHELTTMYKLSQ